jgi:hypothetical protein
LLGVHRIGPAARNYADGPAKEQYRLRCETGTKLYNLRDTSLAVHRHAERSVKPEVPEFRLVPLSPADRESKGRLPLTGVTGVTGVTGGAGFLSSYRVSRGHGNQYFDEWRSTGADPCAMAGLPKKMERAEARSKTTTYVPFDQKDVDAPTATM